MSEVTKEQWKKLVKIVRAQDQSIKDLWEELGRWNDVRAGEEDDLRELMERNRRAVNRLARRVKEMEE